MTVKMVTQSLREFLDPGMGDRPKDRREVQVRRAGWDGLAFDDTAVYYLKAEAEKSADASSRSLKESEREPDPEGRK